MQAHLSESFIQQSIFTWFHNNYCLPHYPVQHCIYHIPNQNQQHLTSIGVKAGVPDLQVVFSTPAGPKFIYIEVKDHKGTQSPAQIKFEQWCIKAGVPYYLVRSFEEAKAVICTYTI